MFSLFPNVFDSYYFLTLPTHPIYFTYDPLANSVKTASNIILVKGQSETTNAFSEEEKCSEKKEDPFKKQRSQRRENQDFTQRRQKKYITQKQVQGRKLRKVSKHVKKTELVQKQGRNSHSNILRKFFKLLSLETKFRLKVQKIIHKLKLQVKVEEYFSELKTRNIDHRNYIRIKEVQGLFEYNNSWINKITRILFQNYLENYYLQHLLSSKKTDNKSIIFHLKGKRTIKEDIFDRKPFENQSNENKINSAE